MAPKNIKFIIIAFLIFWIALLGWGLMKTNLKLLSQKKAAQKQPQTPPLSAKPEQDALTVSPVEQVSQQTQPEQKQQPAIMVRTFKVKPTDFRDYLPVMGSIKAETETKLKFEINGKIQKINFREGEKISRGDIIASVDPKDSLLKLKYAESKLESTKAAASAALKRLEINQNLFDSGAIIKSKLEEMELEAKSAQSQIATAEAEKELAQNELRKTTIYASKEGIMGPRDAEEGEIITPQDTLGSLLEVENVFVEVGVVERDINKIRLGQKAQVFVDAQPGKVYEGTIDSIFPVVEGKSRTLTAKIKMPNKQGVFFPGMFSRAEINIIELKGALIVPAIVLIQSSETVRLAPVIPQESIKVSEDEIKTGVLQLRQVKVGYITSDYAQILDGLNEGDLVVTETQGELQDNARVRIVGMDELDF